jgi:hypothetical protein
MKIKLVSLALLLIAALGLSGCYEVYPGGYGYGGAPVYAGRYYPAGGWGYPAYYGHDYWHHDSLVPEHRGFIAHDFGAPTDGHGFAVAHGGFRGAARGGAGYHGGRSRG